MALASKWIGVLTEPKTDTQRNKESRRARGFAFSFYDSAEELIKEQIYPNLPKNSTHLRGG
jgi:hypothetical protein